MAINEGSSYNSLGETLMNVLRKRNGGKFPTTATRADIIYALDQCNKETSDYMVRLGAAGLERAGVRVQGVSMESVEPDRLADVDFLVSSAERDVPVTEALKHLREKGNGKKGDGKSKARQTAEKMARKAGKSEDDDDWDKTVDKFEKNQQESVVEPLKEAAADELDKMREKLDKMSSNMTDPKAKELANAIRRDMGKLKGML